MSKLAKYTWLLDILISNNFFKFSGSSVEQKNDIKQSYSQLSLLQLFQAIFCYMFTVRTLFKISQTNS